MDKQYNYILIDADNTLFNFTKCEKKTLLNTGNDFNIKITNEILNYYHKLNDQYWKKFEKGQISDTKLKIERFEKLFKIFNIQNIDAENFNDKFKENLANENILMDNSLNLLKYFKQQNKKVFIITNGTKEVQIKRFSNSTLKNYIDDLIISDDIGYTKPNIEFFKYIFKKYPQINNNNTIVIGDSATADIQGGKNAGLDTIYFDFNNVNCKFCTYKVSNLLEIEKIVK